jgi:hypothetical protein
LDRSGFLYAMMEAEDSRQKGPCPREQCRAWAQSTRHAKAKEIFLLLENEWRTLVAEIQDIEHRRKFVADAEIRMRQLPEDA